MQDSNTGSFTSGVIKILTGRGTGSGFLIENNMIITNHHVVEGYKHVAIEQPNHTRLLGVVKIIDPNADLAIVIPQEVVNMPPLELGASSSVKRKDRIHILGYPLGMPFSTTEGVISNPKQLLGQMHYIQTDAAINPGNSGGPMLNESGQVVGITTCKFTNAENMGFAVPSEHATDLIKVALNSREDYSVRCPSCSSALSKPIQFCESCGSELNIASYFNEAEKDVISNFVEQSLTKLGMNPVLARSGPQFWSFHKGSALIRIYPWRDQLIGISPLAMVTKNDPAKLYRYMLEFNEGPYFIFVYDNLVYFSLRLHLSDIFESDDKNKLSDNLSKMVTMADDLDNKLMSEFGCEPAPQTNKYAL